MRLLEYNPECKQFHHNIIFSGNHGFVSPVFSNGWMPVCVIPDELTISEEYMNLIGNIKRMDAPYKTVVCIMTYWVMREMEKMGM